MDSAHDVELLALGLIPASLNYNAQQKETLDWSKLEYNARYKTPEYYYNRLPKAVKNLPGLWGHCEYMAKNGVSPLESLLQIEMAKDKLYDA